MATEMAIRVSNGPAKDLLRVHAEHSNWDEPAVRYLRRKPNGSAKTDRLHLEDNDKVAFEFGSTQVTIHAVEDHVEIVLRHVLPQGAMAA